MIQPNASHAVTAQDVAALAGVSTATVSNFFNHPQRMSASTRERIRAIVDELDFAPNDAARTLRRGSSSVVAYMAFELASARTPAIVDAVAAHLKTAGLHLVSAVDGGEPARQLEYIRLFESQRVAGLIVTPVYDIEPELARLRDRGLPSVLSARRARSPEQASVSVNHTVGGRLAAEHLMGIGRRRIAFVTDTLELPQIADRFEGARAVIRRTPGAELEVLWAGSRSVAGGVKAAADLWASRRRPLPDAVICVNDLVAMGLTDALRERVAIPRDLAVVGYDDIEFASLGAIPLTTIHTPQEELGTTAAQLLLDERAATREHHRAQQIELDPHLVIRSSTAR